MWRRIGDWCILTASPQLQEDYSTARLCLEASTFTIATKPSVAVEAGAAATTEHKRVLVKA